VGPVLEGPPAGGGAYKDLSCERRGDVAVLTLRRPQVHNALRARTYAELEDAVRTTDARVLVITGEDPSFCSGEDVREMMAPGAAVPAQLREPAITPAADALLSTDVPIVAAVNGAALGWGMELALLADVRIASERARFAELFVKRGLCCDVAGFGRLVQLVGRAWAAELLLTGRDVGAEEAACIGLVSRVVEHDALMDAALELANAIAENPPLAVARIKAGLRTALDPDWGELGRWVSATLVELFASEDHRESVQAFLERRAPVYGRR
jgi:enoyl-CoA hydratase/carnithine racemase